MDIDSSILAELAVEFWKAIRSHERTLQMVPIMQLPKIQAQIRFSSSRLVALLAGTGFALIEFDGEYSPNLPATPVNGDDFAGTEKTLMVERTIEPAVVNQEDMRVVRMGKVWIREGDTNVPRD